MTYPKRLIEVDLPIKEISAHARREKSIRHGHISTLHIWWARRPLAACRAVICAALWPDPAGDLCPQSFREAAARILADLAEQTRRDAALAGLVKDHWSHWHRTNAATFGGKTEGGKTKAETKNSSAFSLPHSAFTTLDRVHQSMLLFAAGRSEALRRFLVDDGVGRDSRYWALANALSALYPPATDEKRWVDGVLARKKGLGF